jgi:rhodanese-related sulfurtransferase
VQKLVKKTYAILIILFMAIVIILYNEQRQQSTIEYGNVTVQEAKKIIEKNPSLVILDVRSREEFESGYIENSYNIPLEELEDFICCIGLQYEDDILVYSNMGIKSNKAMEILISESYTRIYNMKEGIRSWKMNGYAVVIKSQ